MARSTSSRTETLVPSSISSSTTPWKARNAARVTTKDGMPTLATRKPSDEPDHHAGDDRREHRDVPREAVQGEQHRPAPRRTRPLAKPADRSISPSSRTKTRPIAIRVTAAPWVNRLAKLPAVRKRRPRDREDDAEHDQAEHGGQRAEVAAAHPPT